MGEKRGVWDDLVWCRGETKPDALLCLTDVVIVECFRALRAGDCQDGAESKVAAPVTRGGISPSGHRAIDAVILWASRFEIRTSASRTHQSLHSIVSAATAVLAREVDFWVHDAHVAGESVVAREGLLFDAESAAHLLLADVVDRVLMASEIIRTREDRVAGLSSCGIDALALVRASLAVARKELR